MRLPIEGRDLGRKPSAVRHSGEVDVVHDHLGPVIRIESRRQQVAWLQSSRCPMEERAFVECFRHATNIQSLSVNDPQIRTLESAQAGRSTIACVTPGAPFAAEAEQSLTDEDVLAIFSIVLEADIPLRSSSWSDLAVIQ